MFPASLRSPLTTILRPTGDKAVARGYRDTLMDGQLMDCSIIIQVYLMLTSNFYLQRHGVCSMVIRGYHFNSVDTNLFIHVSLDSILRQPHASNINTISKIPLVSCDISQTL